MADTFLYLLYVRALPHKQSIFHQISYSVHNMSLKPNIENIKKGKNG